MSDQNVATVCAVWDAVNRGGFDEAVVHLAEHCVADWSESNSPESGVYRGRGEIRRTFEDANESWSEADYFEDEIDAGGQVTRMGGLRARGRGSGAEVVARGTQVWTFREGIPVSVRLYQSKEGALEAIGLSG